MTKAGGSDANPNEGPEEYRDNLELAQSTFLAWSTFAHQWYWDASNEVPAEGASYVETTTALRRQVVFATCALESWFFEWVRDSLLSEPVDATRVCAGYRSFPELVKGVMEEVGSRGGLTRDFACGESTEWEEMIRLLRVRNGLVHAAASRPGGNVPDGIPQPEPTAGDLHALAPAEPLRIVRDVARFLTSFADAQPPDWMHVPGRED